jgi:hypothetical protein
MAEATCQLAPFADTDCRGDLVRVHLLEKQWLRRAGFEDLNDVRTWVAGCGGLMGLGGHHGELDSFLLRIPFDALPDATVALAKELGLLARLERKFPR